jgi:trans-2,3-dihydro-3-hydroxyanthranilate isomerase
MTLRCRASRTASAAPLTSFPFYLVDVFAERPLTGNPLAVVADADALGEDVMRLVAREFNQSETTFVLPARRDGASWRLRSFTPTGDEVVGAGHNALGAWWWLAGAGRVELDADGGALVAQEIGERVLPVRVLGRNGRPDAIVLEQSAPEFLAKVEDVAELAAALGLERANLAGDARVVSTGAAHLMVPVRDRSVVERVSPDPRRLRASLADVGGQGCYVYCLDPVSSEAIAHARFFNPTVGIWEDPATGSAAGPLVSRLVAEGVAPSATPVLVEQGHTMGRPSRIRVEVDGDRVSIGGACVVIAEGTLTV